MTTVPPKKFAQKINQSIIVGHLCKKPGSIVRDCRKRMKKEQEQSKTLPFHNTKVPKSKAFARRPPFQRTIYPAEKVLEWS